MNVHVCVLGLQPQGAEAEHVLEDAALVFVDILQNPEVDALVLVGGEECFFDAVDPAVCDDGDVEEVSVEADEEEKLEEKKTEKKEDNGELARARVFQADVSEGDPGREADGDRCKQCACERPQHAKPVLAEVKLESFLCIPPLKIDGCVPGSGSGFYHVSRREPARQLTKKTVWATAQRRKRLTVKNAKWEASLECGK